MTRILNKLAWSNVPHATFLLPVCSLHLHLPHKKSVIHTSLSIKQAMENNHTQTTLNDNDHNLLFQIWARLPLESLSKFRSVCKLWNSLISSDPLLSYLHHQIPHKLSTPNLIIFLRHQWSEPVQVTERPLQVSIRPFEEIIQVARSPNTQQIRNGFTPYVDFGLSFVPTKGPLVCVAADLYFYFCNPSTQEFLRVSPGQNGSLTTLNAGFGYLGDVNRYILVTVFHEKCEILEFGPSQARSAQWQEVKQRCPGGVSGFGVMVDQAFYWRVTDGLGFVVCLDLKEEEFRLIGPPPQPHVIQLSHNQLCLLSNKSYTESYPVEFKGCLCNVDNLTRSPKMDIWVLNKIEGEFSWVRKYSIYLPEEMKCNIVYPFCNYEGENDGDMALYNYTRSRLYCYYSKSQSVKQVFKTRNRTSVGFALYTPGLSLFP